MPTDPVTTIAPANVIDGHFKLFRHQHEGAPLGRARGWNDPDDFYRPAIEVVQNDDMLMRFGWRQT
jgi:predicted phage tail protein